MRIATGRTDARLIFVAVDATDLKTRETGLTGFTVYRSRNGGTPVAYTTPTVTELSSSNMPGVYALTIDEDTTIASGADEEDYCVHITHASMAPVTRTVELFRPKLTEGTTVTVAQNGVNLADDALSAAKVAGDAVTEIQSGLATAAALATVDDLLDTEIASIISSLATIDGVADAIAAAVADVQSRLPAALVSGRMDCSVGAMATGVLTAAALAAAGANKLADHVLRRTYANARASSDGDTLAFRSAMGMLAQLVNKWDLTGSNLVVKHEDDATTFATIPVTTDGAAVPIIGKDPA